MDDLIMILIINGLESATLIVAVTKVTISMTLVIHSYFIKSFKISSCIILNLQNPGYVSFVCTPQ